MRRFTVERSMVVATRAAEYIIRFIEITPLWASSSTATSVGWFWVGHSEVFALRWLFTPCWNLRRDHASRHARTMLRSRNARWQLRSLHSQRPTVGFVGAGNMGRGMAASLARAGLPVAQFDRDPAALAASAAASPLIEAVGRCA